VCRIVYKTVTVSTTLASVDAATETDTITATSSSVLSLEASVTSDFSIFSTVEATATLTYFETVTSTFTTFVSTTNTVVNSVTATTIVDEEATTTVDVSILTTVDVTATVTGLAVTVTVPAKRHENSPVARDYGVSTGGFGSIPDYARPCSGLAQYSSACSCIGVTRAQVTTLDPSISTSTVTATAIYTEFETTIVATVDVTKTVTTVVSTTVTTEIQSIPITTILETETTATVTETQSVTATLTEIDTTIVATALETTTVDTAAVTTTYTTDIISDPVTTIVATLTDATITVVPTVTATPTPTTFLLQEQTGPHPGQYIYVNPSTSATGRYIFFTSSVTQASTFTVNPVTGNLQDTSTGYDIYLTNSNSVIAVAQAYDAATAATTANVAGKQYPRLFFSFSILFILISRSVCASLCNTSMFRHRRHDPG
jgi:hypothetical protein